MPFTSPRWRPPMTPATGPDITVWIGVRCQHACARRSAVRFHHQRARARKAPQRQLFQRVQIARDRRADIGIGHGRGRALVFAPFRIDFVRQRHVEAGRDGANDLGRGLLVARDWRRRTGSTRRSPRRRRQRACATAPATSSATQRLDHLALGAEPFADLEDAVAREQHSRRRGEDVEHVLAAPLPADLVDVAESARRQQPHAHALAFEQGVERGGRAVQDQRYRIRAEVAREILA